MRKSISSIRNAVHKAVFFLIVPIAGLSLQTIAFASDELVSSEGPFVGGVFSRKIPTDKQLLDYEESVRKNSMSKRVQLAGEILSNSEGVSNELIVLLDDDDPATRKILPQASINGAGFESALIGGVKNYDRSILNKFENPIDAYYLISEDRLLEAELNTLNKSDPVSRLHRYVVLRYSSVEGAINARKALMDLRGVIYVGNNRKFESSWAPNDPYFPIKSTATNAAQYQWGLHAMYFPSAWEIERGHGYVMVIDSGVPNNIHPDLLSNYRAQFSDNSMAISKRGHGTHVIGIIAGVANNGIGVSGGCPSCSVGMLARNPLLSSWAFYTKKAVDYGFQVINMSFGSDASVPDPSEYSCPNPSDINARPVCDALAYAKSRDVLVVASAGNYYKPRPQFPASEPSVLAVGGVELVSPTNPFNWKQWYYGLSNEVFQPPLVNNYSGSNYPGSDGVMAPAKGIVSTFPPNESWNALPEALCQDTAGDESGIVGDGYASCTGTSMSAPFVSALAGILRSINPRLSVAQIKQNIIGSTTQLYGVYEGNLYLGTHGVPRATNAVNATLAQTTNSLTPLFSLYSASRQDYFYTSVPQMAAAARSGTLMPRSGAAPGTITYSPVGTGVTGYPSFPGVTGSALAQVWVFTTPKNPKSASIPLVPLYRMSWKCGDPSSSPPPAAVCTTFPAHIDTCYTADAFSVTTYQGLGYKLDGIEGYIYPKNVTPQPPGTVRLMRKYNPARDDHAIFPESLLVSMQNEGYTQDSGSDWLGYVYPNSGGVPTIQ